MKSFTEYKSNPHECIFCDSPNIELRGQEWHGDYFIVDTECGDCGQEWTEEYETNLIVITYYDENTNRATELT